MRQFLLFLATFFLLVPPPCLACLWDHDTIEMERRDFPEAHELIAGYFLRHSDAYYEWRIADRTAKPIDDRTPNDYDDIAVAYDKLGKHDKAIETIREKIKRWPGQGRYESEANLGTFLIHAGRMEDGLPHITSAITINPDAHFGREIYQKLLVEYVLESRSEGNTLPLSSSEPYGSGPPIGFAAAIVNKRNPSYQERQSEFQAAVKGVLGMMRFGSYDSPILLEALGDLLVAGDRSGAKMLAARAYLKASYEVSDPDVAEAYRKKAMMTIKLQEDWKLSEIETELKKEIERGDSYFAKIKADEEAWVDAEKNLDEEFGRKYYEKPVFIEDEESPERWWLGFMAVACGLLGGIVVLVLKRMTVKPTS